MGSARDRERVEGIAMITRRPGDELGALRLAALEPELPRELECRLDHLGTRGQKGRPRQLGLGQFCRRQGR